MKITANHPLLVFSFLLIAFFGFGQTNKQAQTTFSLDLASLSQSLAGSPDFSEKSLHKVGAVIELPMPDGVRKSFRMFRTHPMHPDLAARYPEIQTYHGKCMEDGVSGVSVTISPTGLHAFLVDEKFQRVYIEPEGGADPARYVSFYEPADAMANYMCPYEHGEMQQETLHKHAPPKGTAPQNVAENMVNSPLAMGDKLRTYRLAMPCTGEFGQANGGTVASVLAVMAASVNAVNLIYIREMAIKFELVPNNDQVLYFDGNTDPYLNDGQIHDPPIVDDLETNNIVCNTVIGASNYDIGHLLQYPTSCPGCGGWAGAGPCIPSFKASGMSINEVGILIHEMGHQFWMPHTTDTGPPNRYDHIAIGNTIMGRNDALPGSSDYFHVSSTDLAATEVEDPGHCVPGVATNNTIPTVTVGTGGMYIPKGTPFQLSGSATDPDPNTTLVYNWQQYNNDTTYNVINHRLYPVGNAPIFRNFFPTTDGNVRTIPRLEDLVNDTIPFGFANCDNMGNNCDTLDLEGLPTYSRNLTFRLVARDFEPTGGAFDYATLSFEVDGNSGPFKVIAPNGGGTWTAGTNADITWDVANTDNAPVSCATVDIFLSLDGGYTYPITIATGTPNDGSYTYAVPGGYPPGTNMVRVKIACATYENVVFFDVSDSDFTISGPCMADAGIIVPGDTVTAVQGSPSLDLSLSPYYGPVTSTPFNVPGTGSPAFFALFDSLQSMCVQGCCELVYNTSQFQVSKAGTYSFDVAKTGGGNVFMSVHNTSFNTANVCDGFLTSNLKECCGGVGNTVPFEASLLSGVNYTMVFHPFFEPSASGTVSFSNNVGGYVIIGPSGPGPGADYGYTYAAINTANGQIAAISPTADFTGLAAGAYEVYGVSYKLANPPPAIVNPNDFLNMTRLQVQVSAQCIVFSENHVYMVVQPGACTPPSFNPPLVTQPSCSTPGTIVVDATGNGTLEYSVDNGATWSTSAFFSGLAPGNYFAKARLQADPTCMASWVFNPIVLNTPTGCTGGKTLDFDGTDDYVALPANLSGTLTNFTIEAWVYWDGSTYWQRILDFGANTTTYMYLTPKGSPGDNPIFAITTSTSSGEERILSSVSAAIGQWQHYAITLDDATNTGTMYIDGVQVGQNTNMTLTPAALGNLPNNYLGKSQWPDPYFDGKLDEVRIWNYAKAAYEVACQKDHELVGNEPGLVAYYQFNQGTAGGNNAGATTLDDLTASNSDGTLTNFALSGNTSNWMEPGAPVLTTPYNCCPAGNVIFVNDDAVGLNTGGSWANAFTNLQTALAVAGSCPSVTQIWVAAGTYKPTNTTNRTVSFVMKNNLAIYGGFNGTEANLADRPSPRAVTILSGDIGTPSDNSDNSYHVVTGSSLNNTAVLDGIFVINGNANDGNYPNDRGGGMWLSNSAAIISNCLFLENAAGTGGGMTLESSSANLVNCAFQGNTASFAGGLWNAFSGAPTITNCTFSGNAASIHTGGLLNSVSTTTTLTNCIFWGNTAPATLDIRNEFSSSCNISYTFLQDPSCPADATCGAGMVYGTNPLFVSTTDPHLQSCSPAKDAGTATGAPATDYDGNARPQGAGYDLGFDENGSSCTNCNTYGSTDTPINILDENTISSIITIPLTGTLTDVNIIGLSGTHTYCGDLIFRLTSPQGTTVVLIQNQCGDQDDFNITLDDQAANPLSCPLNAGNTQQPQNPLSAFNGENPVGSWTLSIEDNAGGDVGILTGWILGLCTAPGGGCPNTLLLSGNITPGTYHAAQDLSAQGTGPNSGGVVVLKAGNSITLLPNFTTAPGGVLETVIEGCPPFAPPASAEKD